MKIDFGRVITAMVTPFDEHDEVDMKEVRSLVEHLINHGSDGIVVAGTTGESPTLTKQEKLQLFKTVKEVAGNRAKVIANIGNNHTKDSVEFAKMVEKETNVDGLLVVNPYYNKPNHSGLFQHFKTIANSTNLPIMLYNIPGRTSVNLNAETTIELSEIPNIVAIKESSGNLDQMSQIIEATSDDFKLYSGDDNLTLPTVAIGGHGVVSVASHFFGEEIKRMIAKKDAKLHRTLLDFFHVIFSDTNPICSKYLLKHSGIIKREDVRLPLVYAENTIKEELVYVYEETKQKLSGINQR